MRDTSQNLVINKQTAHPIKHLTSPCLSLLTHTQSGLRWSEHIKVYQTGTTWAQPWPGLNPLPSPPSSLGRLCTLPSLPTCPSAGQWEHHPDTCTTAPTPVRAFIFHCQAQITRLRLCTRRHGKCCVCQGFVNRHTFCERGCEWDEVTNCWSGMAVAEGRGWPEAKGILDCPVLTGVCVEWDSE